MEHFLYIGGKRADVDADSLFLYNYTFTDLASPAAINNSFSQGVTLPGTPTNDAIFNHYYRLDRLCGSGYCALDRVGYELVNAHNEVLASGYVRLEGIKAEANGTHSYSVSLYGGMGGFLHYWNIDENTGERRTLYDLYFADLGPTIQVDANNIWNSWDELHYDATEGEESGTINWAPCYEGTGESGFDYNKAYYKPGGTDATKISGVAVSAVDGYGTTYIPHPDADGGVLLEMSNKHTGEEMAEFRSYLLRPVLSIRAFLTAMEDDLHRGDGYSFEVDGNVKTCDFYKYAWLTLPRVDWAWYNGSHSFTLAEFFKGGLTPAEVLIGLVKTFGLVLTFEPEDKTIILKRRDDFFNISPIDFSHRVTRVRNISPSVPVALRYSWSVPCVGEFAEAYRNRWGQEYGAQMVNTGYAHNAETKQALEDYPFKAAPDACEHSPLYLSVAGLITGGVLKNYAFAPAFVDERVTWKLYKNAATRDPWEMTYNAAGQYRWQWSGVAGDDSYFMDMPQIHGEGGKSNDGSGILVYYAGGVSTPHKTGSGGNPGFDPIFRITDDNAAMLAINGGRPCWDASPSAGETTNWVPSFVRSANLGGNAHSLDMGEPLETISKGVWPTDCGAYDNAWWAYMDDIFDRDSKIVRAQVDLAGEQVRESLLGQLVWFDNAVWAISKIINYSPTAHGLTECEFIRVQDDNSYIAGQTI